MAEQEIYGSHIGLEPGRASAAFKSLDFSHSSGAEQERYASHFGLRRGADLDNPVEPPPSSVPPPVVAPPPPIASPSFTLPGPEVNTTAVGILKSTLLPSLGLHSGLSLVAYTGARVADRVEAKDWLWPSGQVINAWWSAIGTRVVNENITLSDAFSTLTYSEKLLLGAVTAWGGRLFYRIASRGIERGRDDPRYEAVKDEPGFWNQAFFTTFLPEAFFQTLITLPFTLPFREPQASVTTTLDLPAYAGLAHGLAVFLFSSGFGLEVLADVQLGRHKDSNSLNTDGVWSVVRHPK
jgi:steroid 5-alpha reductase family enzyme